jgi:hypothetical protein
MTSTLNSALTSTMTRALTLVMTLKYESGVDFDFGDDVCMAR